MKADLGKTWYKVRKLRRWFEQGGLSSESEISQRKQVQSITDPHANLVCEMVPFELEKPGCHPEIREAEFGYVADLNQFIHLHLVENEKNGRLAWNNAIPENEVHLKLGGDAGGGSFKMAFQIANLRHPNSKTNTVVFAMFHAKDSWANLKTALMKYKEQVNTLKETTWGGKKKVVFLFGDYEFLCKTFGIAGASGKYPCLWCKINHEVMQVSCYKREHAEKRSLENIREDYDKFVADGSVTSRQKFYHNVTHEILNSTR
ncbi:uncharacterized protein LOC111323624 [Stylophora pistillata]|uniref:uncharacterized protein LOC111323624 n=1 Tax=Stylophora pistillata TaxID=50429 RepID=UPI000C046433|nr:uncharacterized protein LOC111323624 [Stylophora pistillata]